MAGNRDFLVGDAMLERCGVMRLHDPTLLVAFGQRVLLSHGDALCLDDVAYQRFRAHRAPPGVAARLAGAAAGRGARDRPAAARTQSRATQGVDATADCADVDAEAARGWLRASAAPRAGARPHPLARQP